MNLEVEGGITEVSLNNARKLIAKRGKPGQLYLNGDQRWGEYLVTAFWSPEQKFTFSGFGWGYPGEGRAGLLEFLQLCGESEADALEIIRVTEGRMEADRWHKTSSSLSLNADFLETFGYL